MSDLPKPLTRREIYEYGAAKGSSDLPTPLTRDEIYLKAIAEKESGGGGGGGTNDYEALENLPQINGVELKGNLSSDDLGIDGELSKDVVTNTTVGAIASGTTLSEGMSFTEFVEKIAVSEIAPTVAFSLSKSGNVTYGDSYTETLTINVSAMGTAKSIDSISWYQGNTLIQTDTIGSTTTGSWTYTMDNATTDTTTFKAIVNYKKSDNTSESITKTSSITFYYNKFYGAVDSLTPGEATVEALTTVLGNAKGGTYRFTTNANRICYAYPKSLGTLSSIKDGNGFSLFDSFTRTEQTYTQNSTSVDYYLYVLTDATTVSNYAVTFA